MYKYTIILLAQITKEITIQGRVYKLNPLVNPTLIYSYPVIVEEIEDLMDDPDYSITKEEI